MGPDQFSILVRYFILIRRSGVRYGHYERRGDKKLPEQDVLFMLQGYTLGHAAKLLQQKHHVLTLARKPLDFFVK